MFMGLNPSHLLSKPVLMDFGSAGPLTRSIKTRKDVLEIAEEESQHQTTISYPPPELFGGELQTSSLSTLSGNNIDEDSVLDYAKCDVWTLGCTLFAILYGASPSECEFPQTTGQPRIIECTHNKVLRLLPTPSSDTPPAQWYSPQRIKELVQWILT
jgi:serine/threonine kinase 16